MLFEWGLGLGRVPGLGVRLECCGGLYLRVWMPCLGRMNLQHGWGLRRSMLSLKLGSLLDWGVGRL